jgi:transposase
VSKKRRTPETHDCAWKRAAVELERKVAEQDQRLLEQDKTLAAANLRLAELERMFQRRSERSKKMPPIVKPSPSREAQTELRKARETVRAEQMEVVVEVVPVAKEDAQCKHCGDTSLRPMGDGKVSTQIEYVAAHFRKRVTKRETLVCACGKHIVTAPAPERWSEGTRYDPSFVAHLVTQKCMASMPIYRLEKTFAQMGVPVARSTMNDLFYRAADKLAPLRDVLLQAIQEDFIVHLDETRLKMTEQKKASQVWALVGEKLTAYRFDLTRDGSVPLALLGKSRGVFVADSYSGYAPLASEGNRMRSGCMAHARRGFFEAGDVPEAVTAVALIGALYAVEHEAAARNIVGTKAHFELRALRSKPIFTLLMKLARHAAHAHGPKTLLGKAARYAFGNIRVLRRFLQDARIPLDNNLAENALRIIALGRKNFLFVHSKEAGEGLALLYSLTTSCARQKVNPINYLTDVLNRIDDTKKSNLRSLLPDRWTPKIEP